MRTPLQWWRDKRKSRRRDRVEKYRDYVCNAEDLDWLSHQVVSFENVYEVKVHSSLGDTWAKVVTADGEVFWGKGRKSKLECLKEASHMFLDWLEAEWGLENNE